MFSINLLCLVTHMFIIYIYIYIYKFCGIFNITQITLLGTQLLYNLFMWLIEWGIITFTWTHHLHCFYFHHSWPTTLISCKKIVASRLICETKKKKKRYNNFGSITKFNHVVPKIIEVINATTLFSSSKNNATFTISMQQLFHIA